MDVLERSERLLSFSLACCGVDCFKVMGYGSALAPRHKRQAIADEMNNAKLHLCVRVDLFNRVRESFESVYTEDEHIV